MAAQRVVDPFVAVRNRCVSPIEARPQSAGLQLSSQPGAGYRVFCLDPLFKLAYAYGTGTMSRTV